MRLSFIVPPCYDCKQPAERSAGCTRIVYPMINIYELIAAATVREAGFDVEYHDFVFGKGAGDKDAFEAFAAADESDVCLIWAVNLSLESDLHAVEILRRHRPLLPVIFMGPGPTYYVKKALSAGGNTFVVRGEPELTLVELCRNLEAGKGAEGVAGVSYTDAEGVIVNNRPRPLNKDLDSLPFAARDLLGGNRYHNPKLKTGPYTSMLTSRNCPFHCIYCVPSSLSFAREIEWHKENPGRKPTIGFRSIESIEKEVAMLASQGYKAIGFMDDNFIWNLERTAAICEIMRRYGIVWGCQARVDAITEPVARELGRSGCLYVDLGIESFDPAILEYVKKGITPDDIYRSVELLKKYKVPVKMNALIGCSPLETRETIKHTLREAKRLDIDQVMFNIVSPFPGTEYYEICKANGWIKGGDYRPTDVQHESILDLPSISAREMERLLFRYNLSYFLSPRFIARQLRKFRSWSEFKAAIKALKIKLFH